MDATDADADARVELAGDGATDAAGLVDGLKRARETDGDDDVHDDDEEEDVDDDIDDDMDGDDDIDDGDGEDGDGERGASGADAARAGGDDADDQLLLPRHTKVVISGNNRTKGKLIGLKGVVKKAVGLGGWHWLALSNGQEVRLQRNALTVLEHPTGDELDSEDGNEDDVENGEEDDDDDEENDDDEDDDEDKDKNTRSRRPTRVPGNGPPSQAAAAAMKRLQDRRRNARPNCQSNFERLTMTTLLNYKKLYELPPNPEVDGNKSALVHEIAKHFMSQKLDEQKVLQQFMCSVADTTQL